MRTPDSRSLPGGFFAFSFLALSPRGFERGADGRSAEGGVRSELELLRAEPRSAIARARGKRAPKNSLMSSLREWERVLNIYLSSCSTVSVAEKGHLIKIAHFDDGAALTNRDFGCSAFPLCLHSGHPHFFKALRIDFLSSQTA